MSDFRRFRAKGDDDDVVVNVDHLAFVTGFYDDNHGVQQALLNMDDSTEIELYDSFEEVDARLRFGDDSDEAEKAADEGDVRRTQAEKKQREVQEARQAKQAASHA
jgi:hypothetical protein